MNRPGAVFVGLSLFSLLLSLFLPPDKMLLALALTQTPLPDTVTGPYDNHLTSIAEPLPPAELAANAITAEDIANLEVAEQLWDTQVFNLAFSQDGQLVGGFALVEETHQFQFNIWDLTSYELVGVLPVNATFANPIFSPDGRYVVFGNYPNPGWIEVWDIESASRVRQYQGGDFRGVQVGFRAAGQEMWAGRADSYQIWNFADGSLIADSRICCDSSSAYAYSSDFTLRASVSRTATETAIIVETINNGNREEYLIESLVANDNVSSLQFSRSQRYLLANYYSGDSVLVNLENPDLNQVISLGYSYLSPVSPYPFSADESMVTFFGYMDGTNMIAFWDLRENRLISKTASYLNGSMFSPDGTYFIGISQSAGDMFAGKMALLTVPR